MQATVLTVNAPHVSAEAFDNEVMIVNLETGNYYSLTGVGAAVWQTDRAGLRRFDAARQRAGALIPAIRSDARRARGVHRRAVQRRTGRRAARRACVERAVASAPAERAEFSPPVLEKYTDMQDLLLIDPIHEVNDEHGWPKMKS